MLSAFLVFIADVHDTGGITIRDMKTIRSNPVTEALASSGEVEVSPEASLLRATVCCVRPALIYSL